MEELWDRIGGEQVRNMGTVGGNIANGSPIGDTPPPLIALGASVTLRQGGHRRTVPLEEFFITYGKQDRKPGEFVESVAVPALDGGPSSRSTRFPSAVTRTSRRFVRGLSCDTRRRRSGGLGTDRIRRHGRHAETGERHRSRSDRQALGMGHY
jgi:xanthine dehydrogenase iron-sulfur cluster and FAD-binding subunit A